nr:hypothetical protein [Tanacetum cinerariifolium]
PYTPSTVTIPTIPATYDSLEVLKRTSVETILNMSPENKAHYELKKEAIHFLLTGIGDEIYSTVDACKTAHKMWIAIERLQQGESLNIQDVVQQTRIQCFNYKEFGHFAKECWKPKRVKDYLYHKEKMLMCKQAEKGVPLQAEKNDWLANTDEEIDEQEFAAHYIYMEKIQETDQDAVECDDKCVALANLILNLKLDVDENKKIQKQLKKENTSLAYELKEYKSILAETSRTLGESNIIQDSYLIALQNKRTELETYKTLNDHIVDYDKLERKLNETLGLLAQKEIDIKEGLKLKAYEISVVKEEHDKLVK